MNLASNLERAAFFFPDRPAIRQGDLEMTYAQLNQQANQAAIGLLTMGIKPGDYIGLMCPELGRLDGLLLRGPQNRGGGCHAVQSSQWRGAGPSG